MLDHVRQLQLCAGDPYYLHIHEAGQGADEGEKEEEGGGTGATAEGPAPLQGMARLQRFLYGVMPLIYDSESSIDAHTVSKY